MSPAPFSLSRRATAIAAGLLATGLAGFAATPRRGVQDLSGVDISTAFPGALGASQRPPPDNDVVLDPYAGPRAQAFVHAYTGFGPEPIMVFVGYDGPAGFDATKPGPEAAYRALRFAVSNEELIRLEAGGRTLPWRAFTARGEGRVEQVLYLMRVGRHFPTDGGGRRRAVLAEAFGGARPDASVLRVSTLAPSLEEALPRLASFAATFLHAAAPTGRAVLLGPQTDASGRSEASSDGSS